MAKTPNETETPDIVFDSVESKERFLGFLACDEDSSTGCTCPTIEG